MIHLALWLVSFCVVLYFAGAIFVLLIATWRVWLPVLGVLVLLVVVGLSSNREKTTVATPPSAVPAPAPVFVAFPPVEGDITPAKDSVASVLSAAPLKRPAPHPLFATSEKRRDHAAWRVEMLSRLRTRKSGMRDGDQFLETVWYESTRAGLEPALVLGLIDHSSNFEQYALGKTGGAGYMQVAPSWVDRIGDGDTSKLFHPQTNLRFGCVILRHYLDLEKGDLYLALGRYNDSRGRPEYPNAVLEASRYWTYTAALRTQAGLVKH